MCGIAALFGSGVERSTLARMLRVAARRGPEGQQIGEFEHGIVGHAALAFVDVGHNEQPLRCDDGSAIVFNGEIYNWRALNESHRLGARNDTQTLLLGLARVGLEFIAELDGQFAFVAQLTRSGRPTMTLVARDKWGICPLVFGKTAEGWLAIGSTTEIVRSAGVRDVKTVPAGTSARLDGTELAFDTWYSLPRVAADAQRAIDPLEVRRFAWQRVQSRIPERPRELFTTLGGIDSQFVTTAVARELGAGFGGAVTVVPWSPAGEWGGDYPDAKATLDRLAADGLVVAHHVVELTPTFVQQNIDRLLVLLGPDLFHLLCGLAEDAVAATVKRLGGRVIMTAGGPDEAGRSYDRWTFLHRGLDEELAWRRLAEQFPSSEGVRAGLIFGEHGIENRVPLADLIELATALRPEQKQIVRDEGDGLTVASLRMDTKIFWRRALTGLLPERCLQAHKEPIHGSTGAMNALFHSLSRDAQFLERRQEFAWQAWHAGWNGIVFGDLRHVDSRYMLTECQLYALYRWSRLEPELFRRGGEQRYGVHVAGLPRCSDEALKRVDKPLCYDWQLGADVTVRPVL